MKLRAFVLSFGVLLSLIPAYSAVAPKPGGICAKAGLVQNYNGKKYTCIKAGKKLVWNSGIAIKIAAPTAIPTISSSPTLTSTPKPTPTPSSSPSPSPSISIIPTPTSTLSPTEQIEVPVGKWQETQFGIVKALSLLKPSEIQKLNFVYSPKTNVTQADKLKASYQEPITFLSSLYVNPRTVTFLVMNETEHDWWWSQARLLSSTMEETWWGGGHCQPTPSSHCGYGTSPNPDGTFHFGQLLGSQFVWTRRDYTISYHESIHVYQLGLMGNRMNALPSWFAEGQANYLGFAFSHQYVKSDQQRSDTLRSLEGNFPKLSKFTYSDWIDWIKKVDSDYEYTFNNGLGYSIGELILEALYNENDYPKIHLWMVAIKDGDDYKTAFKKVFNQDYDEWLQKVAVPYIDSQI